MTDKIPIVEESPFTIAFKSTKLVEYLKKEREKEDSDIFKGNLVICPIDKDATDMEYCKSFSRGNGCRDIKICWKHRIVENMKDEMSEM